MHKLSAGVRSRLNVAVARLAICAALATALSGCYSDHNGLVDDGSPPDVRQRHPIAIREGERTLDLFVGANRESLTPVQRADVAAFGDRWYRDATGGMIIHVPKGSGNARAADAAVAEVRAILLASGVPARAIAVRPYRATDPATFATVRIAYPRMVAQAGPCGLWPRDIGPSLNGADFQNREYWNFGCASQRNLAAMVANPADLVQPRGEDPLYEARRAAVLDKYRRGEDPSTSYRIDKGKVSDVGQ